MKRKKKLVFIALLTGLAFMAAGVFIWWLGKPEETSFLSFYVNNSDAQYFLLVKADGTLVSSLEALNTEADFILEQEYVLGETIFWMAEDKLWQADIRNGRVKKQCLLQDAAGLYDYLEPKRSLYDYQIEQAVRYGDSLYLIERKPGFRNQSRIMEISLLTGERKLATDSKWETSGETMYYISRDKIYMADDRTIRAFHMNDGKEQICMEGWREFCLSSWMSGYAADRKETAFTAEGQPLPDRCRIMGDYCMTGSYSEKEGSTFWLYSYVKKEEIGWFSIEDYFYLNVFQERLYYDKAQKLCALDTKGETQMYYCEGAFEGIACFLSHGLWVRTYDKRDGKEYFEYFRTDGEEPLCRIQ